MKDIIENLFKLVSSEDLSKYYRDIIKANYETLKDLLSPIIFTVTSFDINLKDVKNPWLRVPKGAILIPSKIYIKKNKIKKLITITSNASNKESENTKINFFVNDSVNRPSSVTADNNEFRNVKEVQVTSSNELNCQSIDSRKLSFFEFKLFLL